MDISTFKMCLDISTLAKNITDRREYNFFRKISSKSRLIAWVGSQSPFLSRQRIDLKSGCSGASQRRQSYPRPYQPPFPHRRHISLFRPKLIPLCLRQVGGVAVTRAAARSSLTHPAMASLRLRHGPYSLGTSGTPPQSRK
jgi:hypothetical protein